MGKSSNEMPNKNWREAVLKEFGIPSKNIRTINVFGGEYFEEITSKGVRILSDKYGEEKIRNYEAGLIVCEHSVYAQKDNVLHCFCYTGSQQQMSREFWTAYDANTKVKFVGEFIFFLKAGKIVKIFEYDLKLFMEDEDGIAVYKKEVEFFVAASGKVVMPYEISASDF